MCQYLPRQWEDALERRVSVLLLMFPRQSGVVVMSRIKTAVKNTSSINVLCGFRLKQTIGQQFSFVLCAVCGLKKKKKNGSSFSITTTSSLPFAQRGFLPSALGSFIHTAMESLLRHSGSSPATSDRATARTTSSATLTVQHSAWGRKKKNTVWFWVLHATSPCSPSASRSAPSPRGGSLPRHRVGCHLAEPRVSGSKYSRRGFHY